jgi:hypothetical protein
MLRRADTVIHHRRAVDCLPSACLIGGVTLHDLDSCRERHRPSPLDNADAHTPLDELVDDGATDSTGASEHDMQIRRWVHLRLLSSKVGRVTHPDHRPTIERTRCLSRYNHR